MFMTCGNAITLTATIPRWLFWEKAQNIYPMENIPVTKVLPIKTPLSSYSVVIW